MTPTCQKCHKQNLDNYYEIFTGDPAIESVEYSDRNINQITGRAYADFQGEQIFICNKCCMKGRNKNQFGFLTLAVLMLLAFGGGGALSLMDMLEGKRLSFYGTVGTILILILTPFIIYWIFNLFHSLFKKDFIMQHGEAIAWAIIQKQERRDFQTIWTHTNFKACFSANLLDGQRGSVTQGIPMTKKDP